MRKATSGRREARAPIASPTPAAAITITMFALSTLNGRSMHPCSYCEVSEVEVDLDLDRWTFYFHALSPNHLVIESRDLNKMCQKATELYPP